MTIIRSYLFFCTVLIFNFQTYAQSYNELLWFADSAFKSENYVTAAYYYKQIIDKKETGFENVAYSYEVIRSNRPLKKDIIETKDFSVSNTENKYYVEYQLAESFRLSYNYENAGKLYAIVAERNTGDYPLARYWYANSLMKNGKYELALNEFENFKNKYNDKEADFYKKAEQGILSCIYALENFKNPNKRIEVQNLDIRLIPQSSAFAALLMGNDSLLLFTAARKKTDKKQGDVYQYDIMISSKTSKGWESPKGIGPPVNTELNEGVAVLSPDKKKLYFTRWNDATKEYAIYVSTDLNGQWLEPMKLNGNVNISGYKTMHPALSANGDTLYFASDRPGGFGKMDLWYCSIDQFGNTGHATNIGSQINTPDDDVAPFYHVPTQTLYFSSNGRIGMGSLDIYISEKIKNSWSEVKNIGYPINTSKDDIYYTVGNDELYAYLTSEKSKPCLDCFQGDSYNIYRISYTPIEINGKVYDAKTKSIIANSGITITCRNNHSISLFTDKNGFYSLPLKSKTTYDLKVKQPKYFGKDTTISTTTISLATNLVLDFYLEPIPITDIELLGVLYEVDKWELLPEYTGMLDELVKTLNVNDNLIIEIGSHTDTRADDQYNLILSEKRAKAVVDYLVEKGIDRERLIAVGYGESNLLIKDAITDEEHQKNRRTTFKILSEDYVPKTKK